MRFRLTQRARRNQALAIALRVVRSAPNWYRGYYLCGRSLERLGRRETEAVRFFIAAKKRSPGHPDVARELRKYRKLAKTLDGSNIYLGKDDSVPPGGGTSEPLLSIPMAIAEPVKRDEDATGGDSDKTRRVAASHTISHTPSALDTRAAAIPTATLAESRRRFSKDRAAANEALCRWMIAGNCQISPLSLVQHADGNCGVHARTRVAGGSRVMHIPLRFIITTEHARRSRIGRAIARAGHEMSSNHHWIAIYLLDERRKGRRSFWQPYIATLPTSFDHLPMRFPPELKRRYLEGSVALDRAESRLRNLRREYRDICNALPAFAAEHSVDDFIWASFVVTTRVFGVSVGGVSTSALVPFADMLNHSRERGVALADWHYDDDTKGFSLVTNGSSRLSVGQELFISYGRKSNARYFVNYGFTVENNHPNDATKLVLTLPTGTDAYAAKLDALDGYPCHEFTVPATYSSDVPALSENMRPRAMFSFLRFCHAAGPSELPRCARVDGGAGTDGRSTAVLGKRRFASSGREAGPMEACTRALSVRNELEVLRHIRRAANQRLSDFPEPIDVDLALLRAGRFRNANHLNCVRMRAGEKETLLWYTRMSEGAIRALHLVSRAPKHEDRRRALALAREELLGNKDDAGFRCYFNEVVIPLVSRAGKSGDPAGCLPNAPWEIADNKSLPRQR